MKISLSSVANKLATCIREIRKRRSKKGKERERRDDGPIFYRDAFKEEAFSRCPRHHVCQEFFQSSSSSSSSYTEVHVHVRPQNGQRANTLGGYTCSTSARNLDPPRLRFRLSVCTRAHAYIRYMYAMHSRGGKPRRRLHL